MCSMHVCMQLYISACFITHIHTYTANNMLRSLRNLRNLRYLKREVIFLLDLVLSTVSTFIACFTILSLFKISGEQEILFTTLGISAVVSTALIFFFGLHKSVVRFFSIGDAFILILFSLLKCVTVWGIVIALGHKEIALYSAMLDLIVTAFIMITVRVVMVITYQYIVDSSKDGTKLSFIYSTQSTNPDIAQQLNRSTRSKYKVKGFLSTDEHRVGNKIVGQPVYSVNQSEEELKKLFSKNKITCVIFTSNAKFRQAQGNLVDFCMRNRISMYLIGELTEIDETTGIPQKQIKLIQIEDLLDRDEINVDLDKISSEIAGKTVMITGAAGSIGSEISRQVATFGVDKLVLFDIAETPIHDLQLEFEKKFPNVRIAYFLGDVRSKHRIRAAMEKHNPTIVFHAAAYKHVPMIEENPCEGVLTNVWGSVNVAQRAIEYGVKKFIMISTDKAVNPTNVMGASKRIAELCVQSMNLNNKTEFITTRFGNVLGSNGSVIPLFKEQIANGGPVTVTHPDIIRYFMTIPEACRLVLQAATMGHAGEILIFDMGQPEKITDLARKMIQLYGYEPDVDIKIEYTGLRPGEKLYEELLKDDENQQSSHEKIQIAKSKITDKEGFDKQIMDLCLNARSANVMETVRIMKQLVPEYKSVNSRFTDLD